MRFEFTLQPLPISPQFQVVILFVLITLYITLFTRYRSFLRSSMGVGEPERHHRAVRMCLGSIGGYLIANFPSAIKETVYLVCYITGKVTEFKQSSSGERGNIETYQKYR